MPHESILLISCHFSFLLYCLGKQIESEHVVVGFKHRMFLAPGRLPGTGIGGRTYKGAMPVLFGVLAGS